MFRNKIAYIHVPQDRMNLIKELASVSIVSVMRMVEKNKNYHCHYSLHYIKYIFLAALSKSRSDDVTN